jgi:hypothetical protein
MRLGITQKQTPETTKSPHAYNQPLKAGWIQTGITSVTARCDRKCSAIKAPAALTELRLPAC